MLPVTFAASTGVAAPLLLISLAAAAEAQPLPARPSTPERFVGAARHFELQSRAVGLSLDRAIAWGLEYNIGLLVAGTLSKEARAGRLEQLSQLLPSVDPSLRESRQRTNLRAFGISFPMFPATDDVSNFDARVSVSAPLIDLHALSNARAADQLASAAEWDARDARETVVLASASAYLQAVSAEAALASAEADVTTARALYDLASDRQRSGVSPEIDTLRSQVEMQSRQQAATAARNTRDKQRVALLRVIGLPVAQAAVLSYADAFWLLAIACVTIAPLVFVAKRPRHAQTAMEH
jgi:outer membrane protein TolC